MSQNMPEHVEKNREKLQGSWSPDKGSNTELSEYTVHERDGQYQAVFLSAQDGGDRSASRPANITE
jgi:hypothetical protein